MDNSIKVPEGCELYMWVQEECTTPVIARSLAEARGKVIANRRAAGQTKKEAERSLKSDLLVLVDCEPI